MFTFYICDLKVLSLWLIHMSAVPTATTSSSVFGLYCHTLQTEKYKHTLPQPSIRPHPHPAAIWYSSPLPLTPPHPRATTPYQRCSHEYSSKLKLAPRGETHFVDCGDWPLHLQEQHSLYLGLAVVVFLSPLSSASVWLWWSTCIIGEVHCSFCIVCMHIFVVH